MKKIICINCGTVGTPVTQTPGSFAVELFLWLMLILPGLLYSVWRLAARGKACRVCGGRQLIPTDSPRGRLLRLSYIQEKPTPKTPAHFFETPGPNFVEQSVTKK